MQIAKLTATIAAKPATALTHVCTTKRALIYAYSAASSTLVARHNVKKLSMENYFVALIQTTESVEKNGKIWGVAQKQYPDK
jgi:hypothetical protein